MAKTANGGEHTFAQKKIGGKRIAPCRHRF
jgi:hypothetical protein